MLGTHVLDGVPLLHIDVAPVGHLYLARELQRIQEGAVILKVRGQGPPAEGHHVRVGAVLDAGA